MGNSNYISYCPLEIIDLIINIETLRLRELTKFLSVSKFFYDNFIKPRYWQKILDSREMVTKFIKHVLEHKCIYPIKSIREICEIHYLPFDNILNMSEYDYCEYDIIPCNKIVFNPLYEERVHFISESDLDEFYKLFEEYRYIQISNFVPNVHGCNCDTIYAYHNDIFDTMIIPNIISTIIPDIGRIIKYIRGSRYDDRYNAIYVSATLDPPFIMNNSKIKNVIFLAVCSYDDGYNSIEPCPNLYNLDKSLPHYLVKLWIPFFECSKENMVVFSKLPNLKFLCVGINAYVWHYNIDIGITLDVLILYIVGINIRVNVPNVKRIDINNETHWNIFDKLELYANNAEECNFNRIHTFNCFVHANNCRKLWMHIVKTQLQVFSKCVREIVVNKSIIGIEKMDEQYSMENSYAPFLIDFDCFGAIKSFSVPPYVHYKLKNDEQNNLCSFLDRSDFHDGGDECNDEWGTEWSILDTDVCDNGWDI